MCSDSHCRRHDELKDSGLITSEDGKKYSLTRKGEHELKTACGTFFTIFYDVHDMATFSKRKGAD